MILGDLVDGVSPICSAVDKRLIAAISSGRKHHWSLFPAFVGPSSLINVDNNKPSFDISRSVVQGLSVRS